MMARGVFMIHSAAFHGTEFDFSSFFSFRLILSPADGWVEWVLVVFVGVNL